MPHIHEKIDFTSEVFIVHKDKVLLRLHDKYHEWFSVGGHIELDEDPIEAAIREVKEEVGLDVTIVGDAGIKEGHHFKGLIPPRYLNRHRVSDTHEHVTFVYFATTDNPEVSDAINAHELAETKWLTREGLKEMDLREDVLFYATEALKELSI